MNNKVLDENLPRWQKLLIVLFEKSKGTRVSIKFEDIVVTAFKRFPQTFHLRGYQEYPDSGDLIHKPLYDMRKSGLLNASQKMFSLTDKGVEAGKRLTELTKSGGESHFKPSRDISHEIERILKLDGFVFFEDKKLDKILDTDFLQYLGVSVHTSKNEFLNRMENMEYAIKQSKTFYPEKLGSELKKFHNFMTSKFRNIILEMRNKKERIY